MRKNFERNELQLAVIKLAILLINTFIFAYIWNHYYANRVYYIPFYGRGNYAVYMIFIVVYYFFVKLYGGFELKTTRATELAYSHAVASVMTGIVMFAMSWLLVRYLPPILPMIVGIGLWVAASIVWAKPANLLMRKIYPPTRTVIIYDNLFAFKKGEAIAKNVDWRFKVVGTININQGTERVYDYMAQNNASAVMLCGIHSSPRNTILKYCIAHNIEVYIRPNIGDYIVNSSKQLQLANLPVMNCQRSSQSLFYAIIKRVFDIVFSIFVLAVLSPILIVVAIAIKLYDGGPVLYSQERYTKDAKIFKIYKFRSMVVDSEADGKARLTTVNDDRITPIGKFIRATRLDEFPQMLNILKGDMSVVGPRPERPEIAEQYEKEMPEFSLRLQVKAGLTGYAQVHGKYNTSPYDKLQMDLKYIARQGIATDLRIILETIKILFIPESTEGISEGGTTASERFEYEILNDDEDE
ncbi:MAG: sugar transferase [Solobacterium sp.]|nr:sugar transferase [Solobacterium sp.]